MKTESMTKEPILTEQLKDPAIGYHSIGYMPMPANFKYKEVFLRGRPRHEKYDSFYLKHPPMPVSRWAKIFSPFAALEGFDECIGSKRVQYSSQRELSEADKAELDKALSILRSLTHNGKAARENRPGISVTYFIPCRDVHSEWYGKGGSYETISGICWKVDDVCRTVTVDELTISFDDIAEISLLFSADLFY